MIVEDKLLNEVAGVDPGCTLSMKIDESNNKKLMAILSTNLYQDPIGSIIREYVSNALDSHRECGNTEPILVKLVKENNAFVFKVEDNGVGLSPDRVENVFAKYLSSTKENDANQLGYYGLGSKSALAYVDSFSVNSRYDSKIYSYLMFKGAEGTELSLLDINDYEGPNGVTICINLKHDNDYSIFLDKMQRQLCFFEGVFVEDEYNDFDNDYKIVKTNLWKYSEINKDDYMHLCLDNVYYPLDFKALGIDPIKIPVGLNFSLKDGIMPTPSRESFLYSPGTKAMILDRIKTVCIEFIEKFNESIKSVDSLSEAHRIHSNLGEITLYKEELNGEVLKEIKVKVPKAIEKIAGIEMKGVALTLFPGLDVENLHSNTHMFLQEYRIYGRFDGDNYITKFGRDKLESESIVVGNLVSRMTYCLQPGESLTKDQIKYLKWRGHSFQILRKHSTTKLGNYNRNNYYSPTEYRGLLKLYKKPKSEWRQLIKEYQAFIKTYTDQFLSISDIVPSQKYEDWKETQRAERKVGKRNTKEQISYFTIRYPHKGNSKNKYVCDDMFTVFTKNLGKQKGIFVYTTEDDDTVSDDMFALFRANTIGVTLVMLSDQNYKKMSKLGPIHNWIKIEDFWNRKNNTLAKMMVKGLLHHVWKEDLDSICMNENANLLDKKAHQAYKKIISIPSNSIFGRMTEEFFSDRLLYYAKNNWLDNTLIQEFKEVFKEVHRFDFLNMFNFKYTNDQKTIKSFALTVYLKLVKEEKATGLYSYKKYDMDAIFSKYLQAPAVEKEKEILNPELDEFVSVSDLPDDEEDITISNEVPEEELVEQEAF